jgi:hypothetical protein
MTGPPDTRSDLVYLGWRDAGQQPDPGPRPEPPGTAGLDEVGAEWLAAQRHARSRLARPAKLGCAVGMAVAAGAAAGRLAGALGSGLALPAAIAGCATAAASLRALITGERKLRARVRAERQQVQRVQQAELAARQEQYARSFRDWQRRSAAFWRQRQWYPVTMPAQVSRLDVAGGTLAGWSALLTMIAAPRLAAGGEVTVLDLTEGGPAADLLALAAAWDIDPLVWVLPADLPRLDLGLRLGHASLAEVLALTATASGSSGSSAESGGPADQARDAALLGRVLEVLGADATMPQLIAALRALAQAGGPWQQLPGAARPAGALSADQLTGLSAMFGRGTERLVVDRAWALEARLRALDSLGTAMTGQPPSRLRVAWPGRGAAQLGSRVLGRYLAVALTEELRQGPAGVPWQHTICLLGAERLAGDVLDRLSDAAECAGAGLVLGYRSIAAPVRERLGRGNAVVAFMRLGNAEDARAAAEQIGSEHRFVISQLTDSVGTSLTGTAGGSYASTAGTASSLTQAGSATWTTGRSRGQGRSRHDRIAPFAEVSGSASRDASTSAAVSDSVSVTEGTSASASWGWSLSRAAGATSSTAGTAQRSRELLVEQHELQHLPETAVVICQHGPAGRQVVLADANPAIMKHAG